MTIQIVGAGLGRTGTHSLKLAIERLLGGTCHHMMEVTDEQGPLWNAAFDGRAVNWDELLGDYCGIVDWPGAGVWREIAESFPDAPVLLSTRSSAEVWLESANNTIFKAFDTVAPEDAGGGQGDFVTAMMNSFCSDWDSPDEIKAAYEAHNAEVRATVSPDRLFEYQPGDGWTPLCAALALPAPDEPFPHSNSTAEFQSRRDGVEPGS